MSRKRIQSFEMGTLAALDDAEPLSEGSSQLHPKKDAHIRNLSLLSTD
ncbi:MAG: hypothetical protein WC343_00620 [Bacilli bacterium]